MRLLFCATPHFSVPTFTHLLAQPDIEIAETQPGRTTMPTDGGMDTDDMVLQQEIDIPREETAPEVAASMAEAGGPLMLATLRGLVSENLIPRPQDNDEGTYAPLLKK